jgi:hypothetical protein
MSVPVTRVEHALKYVLLAGSIAGGGASIPLVSGIVVAPQRVQRTAAVYRQDGIEEVDRARG